MGKLGLCACGAEARYRCPACDARSCSLACVQQHKAERACSGVRDPAKYCSMQTFDDTTLKRDFGFLEGVVRGVDSSKRARRETERPAGPARYHAAGLTPARQHLLRHASERGVQLELLPHGMTRQRENSTRYDARRQSLGWRVELRFVDAGALHVVSCVPEATTLLQLMRSCLEPNVSLTPRADSSAPEEAAAASEGGAHATPPPPATPPTRRDDGQRALLRHRLRVYGRAGAAALRIYMRAECRRADDPRYHRLLLDASLGESLRGKAVIEFPILHVALPTAAEADEEEGGRFPLLRPGSSSA